MDTNLKYKVVEKMTQVVDNFLECITIELVMEKRKNTIVNCIYRTPGSNINTFNDWMEEMFTRRDQIHVNSYNEFLRIFKTLNDKHCPIKQYYKKNSYKEKPRITKGLENACKKKNTLYREFIKSQTKIAEEKYKKYINKLINIIRSCKKDYYHRILENSNNNMRGTWRILNEIISNSRKQATYPEYFNNIDQFTKLQDIANRFNSCFVEAGPNLAKNIPDTPESSILNSDILVERNSHSMFMEKIDNSSC